MAPNWAIFGHFLAYLAIILVILLSSFPIGLGASDGATSTKNSGCSTVLDAFTQNTNCLPGESGAIPKCYQSILVPINSAKPAKRFQLGQLECGDDGGQPIPIEGDKMEEDATAEDAMADGAHLEDIFSAFLVPNIPPNANNVLFLPQNCKPDSPPSTSIAAQMSTITTQPFIPKLKSTTTTQPSNPELMSTTTTRPFIPELNKTLILAEKLTPGMGYLLRATPKADWVRISIGLIKNGNDGKETTLLRFIADADIGQLKVESDLGKNNPPLMKENNVIKGGKEFEIQFDLKQTHIVVVLDDVEIFTVEMAEPEIHAIKIEADFDITMNEATLMTPRLFKMKFSYDGSSGTSNILTTSIRGKVKKDAKSFTVNIIRNWVSTRDITEENKCSEIDYMECDLPLRIDIDFKGNKILLTSLDFGGGVKIWRDRPNQIENKIKPDDHFGMKIGVIDDKQFKLQFTGDPYPHTVVVQETTGEHYLEIKGDFLLFGEPDQGMEEWGTIQ